jgi:hypothetical protein
LVERLALAGVLPQRPRTAAVFRDWFEDVLGTQALKPLVSFDR